MFDINKPRHHKLEQTTEIAKALKLARTEAGITQKALADFSDVGIKSIRTLEQGGLNVSLEKLQQLMTFLGLEILVLPRDEAAAYRKEKTDA